MSRLIDNGGPAFPVSVHNPYNPGMTLRDYFAAKAMPLAMNRLRENYNKELSDDWRWDEDYKEFIAAHSYAMADAMLLERQQ
jgi:hypothetical protein